MTTPTTALRDVIEALDCCYMCDDGDGQCAYPYYGLAPHRHEGMAILGSTRLLPASEWPANFSPDHESEGAGVYTHCLHCGRPQRVALVRVGEG